MHATCKSLLELPKTNDTPFHFNLKTRLHLFLPIYLDIGDGDVGEGAAKVRYSPVHGVITTYVSGVLWLTWIVQPSWGNQTPIMPNTVCVVRGDKHLNECFIPVLVWKFHLNPFVCDLR